MNWSRIVSTLKVCMFSGIIHKPGLMSYSFGRTESVPAVRYILLRHRKVSNLIYAKTPCSRVLGDQFVVELMSTPKRRRPWFWLFTGVICFEAERGSHRSLREFVPPCRP